MSNVNVTLKFAIGQRVEVAISGNKGEIRSSEVKLEQTYKGTTVAKKYFVRLDGGKFLWFSETNLKGIGEPSIDVQKGILKVLIDSHLKERNFETVKILSEELELLK